MNPSLAIAFVALCGYVSAGTLSEELDCLTGVMSGSCVAGCEGSMGVQAKQAFDCFTTNINEVIKCVNGKIGSQDCINLAAVHKHTMEMAAKYHHSSNTGAAPANGEQYQAVGSCIQNCFKDAKCGAGCTTVPTDAFFSEAKTCFENQKAQFETCRSAQAQGGASAAATN